MRTAAEVINQIVGLKMNIRVFRWTQGSLGRRHVLRLSNDDSSLMLGVAGIASPKSLALLG